MEFLSLPQEHPFPGSVDSPWPNRGLPLLNQGLFEHNEWQLGNEQKEKDAECMNMIRRTF